MVAFTPAGTMIAQSRKNTDPSGMNTSTQGPTGAAVRRSLRARALAASSVCGAIGGVGGKAGGGGTGGLEGGLVGRGGNGGACGGTRGSG
eukprot:7376065-Prymnesium_polylepis.2